MSPTPIATSDNLNYDDASYNAAVVVDPFSSGAVLSKRITERGLKCIRVFSRPFPESIATSVPQGLVINFSHTIQHNEDLDATARKLKETGLSIKFVMPGCETGVELSDALSHCLGLPTNGTELSHARRDKYAMGERIRDSGLRAVKQRQCHHWDHVEDFISSELGEFPVIVKPARSAATDGVFFCETKDDLEEAFSKVCGKENKLGEKNEGALVQEFLNGTEYVVDCVSKGGQHKVVAVWEYDKRPCNGAKFVYHGMKLRAVDDEKAHTMVEYMKGVLDALNIQYGPTHGEVIWCKDGPCLVEVGCRPHGGEATFTEIVDRCLGYNQIDLSIDVYHQPAGTKVKYDSVPEVPKELMAHGMEAFFIARSTGLLKSLPRIGDVRGLSSYICEHLHLSVGEMLHRTVDFFTTPGSVMLVHEDRSVVDEDFENLREIECNGLFECH